MIWFAEAFSENGVTTDGILVRPIDGTHTVQVEVNDNVAGDVMLYAMYPEGENGLKISSAFPVVKRDLQGATLAGFEVNPNGIALAVSEQVRMSVTEIYSDGRHLQRHVEQGNVEVSSSDGAVIDVSDPLFWRALKDGATDITVSYRGLEQKVSLTVGQQVSDSPFEAWLGQYFSPAELTNESLIGFGRDPDGDGFANGIEFVLGQSPIIAEPQSGGLRVGIDRTLTFPISTQAKEISVLIEKSADLQSWQTHYDVTADPNRQGGVVRSVDSEGEVTKIRIDALGDHANYFRIRAQR